MIVLNKEDFFSLLCPRLPHRGTVLTCPSDLGMCEQRGLDLPALYHSESRASLHSVAGPGNHCATYSHPHRPHAIATLSFPLVGRENASF